MSLVAIALLLLLALGLYARAERQREDAARGMATHSLQVLRQGLALENAALQFEVEHRAFLITGERHFLASRDAWFRRAQASLDRMRALTADNARQQARLHEIGELLLLRRSRMLVSTAPGQSIEASRERFAVAGAGSLEPLRAALEAFGRVEARLLQAREAGAAARARQMRMLLVLGPGMGILMLAAAGLVLGRQARRNASLAADLARDISARRRAEDERDLFFSLSLDMLCISSGDGYFKRLSPAFTRTLGWSVEEMLARPFLDFIHPDDIAATQAEVDRQVRDGASVLDFENRFSHKDGGWRWLSWKSAPQPDGRMYATARDVTERKQAEDEAQRLNRELGARQAELQSANRELEAFSYSVSHDLRAPLRHIDGYARMLEEDAGDALPPEPRRYLRTIKDSARRMGLLIDDLLAFSRLGRKPLARQRVDMRALAQRALSDLPDSARLPDRVQLGALPDAQGDPALLQQVWANLLSNALKYSAPRGDAARVTVGGDSDGGSARYWVRDNGVGFDMQYSDKLFGVFQRLHGPEQFEGTGVGLAIVQRIVARHGGHVSASGEPDRGACFRFELPAHQEAA